MTEITGAAVAKLLPKRDVAANKYSVGTMLAVTGSRYMTGAAALAAKGALLCGTGLLYQASDKYALPVLQAKLDEPVFTESSIENIEKYLVKAKAVLFGCGVEKNVHNAEILEYILSTANCPVVLDASAFGLIKESGLSSKLNENTVITPHEGEFETLTGAFPKDREKSARIFACNNKCTLVLKGHNTIIANKSELYVCPTGNAGMAKGGYGDLLAGMLASFASQGLSALDAAICAVYLNGLAGDMAAEKFTELSALPSLAADLIPEAIKQVKKEV